MPTPAWNEGYAATTAYANPYWASYPKDDVPVAEQIAARQWVDGYVQAIKDRRPNHDMNHDIVSGYAQGHMNPDTSMALKIIHISC